jgi:hypothetical protein
MDGISTRRMNIYLLLTKRLKPGSSQNFFKASRSIDLYDMMAGQIGWYYTNSDRRYYLFDILKIFII